MLNTALLDVSGVFLMLFAVVSSFLPSRPKKLQTAQAVVSQGPRTLITGKPAFRKAIMS